MTQLIPATVALVTLALLIAMSLRANGRFKTESRLPMQWWLDGQVTWTAPRPVALAFTPVLAAVCLGGIIALTAIGRTRPGQEDLVVPISILVGLFFLGVHALHLWLMRLTIQRRR